MLSSTSFAIACLTWLFVYDSCPALELASGLPFVLQV